MKRSLGMVMIAALLFAVLACKKKETAKAEDDYVFKIGYTFLCHAPLYIALDQGYYEEEGLKWEIVQVGDGEAFNLLTNGSVDGLITLMVGLIQPLSNGLPVKIPLAMHTGCVKALVRGDSDITTAVGLRGKKIGGAGPSSPPLLFVKRYLAGLGLKVDGENADVEFIYQTAAELPLLLERGAVDAIAVTDPAARVAQDSRGFRAVINNADDEYFKDEFCCAVPVRAETVASHPEATAKFLRAIQKAAKFIQDNPYEAAQILSDNKHVSGDAHLNGEVLETFSYRASVSQVLPALDRNARDMLRLGLIRADVDVDALVKDVYVAVPGVPDSLF